MAEVTDTESGPGDRAAKPAKGDDPRVVIKKYANRRLYNTASSSYVTLEHLSDMVKEGVDFVVYDAKSGDEITRSVLTQIIFEEESRGQNLLPIQFLRQLIRFYGDSMQAFVPSYLEMSLASFSKQHERLAAQFAPLAPKNPLAMSTAAYEEQVRQNLAMFDRAMKIFTPFGFAPQSDEAAAPEPEPVAEASPAAAPADALEELKAQMEAMRAKLDRLSSKD